MDLLIRTARCCIDLGHEINPRVIPQPLISVFWATFRTTVEKTPWLAAPYIPGSPQARGKGPICKAVNWRYFSWYWWFDHAKCKSFEYWTVRAPSGCARRMWHWGDHEAVRTHYKMRTIVPILKLSVHSIRHFLLSILSRIGFHRRPHSWTYFDSRNTASIGPLLTPYPYTSPPFSHWCWILSTVNIKWKAILPNITIAHLPDKAPIIRSIDSPPNHKPYFWRPNTFVTSALSIAYSLYSRGDPHLSGANQIRFSSNRSGFSRFSRFFLLQSVCPNAKLKTRITS